MFGANSQIVWLVSMALLDLLVDVRTTVFSFFPSKYFITYLHKILNILYNISFIVIVPLKVESKSALQKSKSIKIKI